MGSVTRSRVLCGALSLALHTALIATGTAWIRKGAPSASDIAEVDIDRDAPNEGNSARGEEASRTRVTPKDVPAPGAGPNTPRADTGERGSGGDRSSPRATHLSDHIDNLDLARQLPSHTTRDQLQRVKSSALRQSIDDRRAATEPMEFSLVSTGDGTLLHHNDAARVRPHGVFQGSLAPSLAGANPEPAAKGGVPVLLSTGANPEPAAKGGVPVLLSTGAENDPREGEGEPADPRGAASTINPRGAYDGDDSRPSTKEDVARARPLVDKARPTVPAEVHARKTADNVDSLDFARAKTRSLVHASFAGGTDEDTGRGGEVAAEKSAPGAGGLSEEGSRTAPLGTSGSAQDLNTRDPRFTAYFHELHRKIDPLWRDAFPKELTLAMKQGTVILEFDVTESGVATVVWPPKRPSGFPVFDENCASAIRRASPFPPIPAALTKLGVRRLRVTAPFSSNNPFAP